MIHLFVLWLALFAAQAPTPVTQPIEPPAAQPAQPPAPPAPGPDQSTPAKPPTPNTDASGSHQVRGGVIAPKILYQPSPEFSIEARKAKINGSTTVSLIVDAQGNPQNVHVIHSLADTANKAQRAEALVLDQKAVESVKQYKFAPATEGGVPVAVYLNIQVNFEIH